MTWNVPAVKHRGSAYALDERYKLSDDDLLVFFSGSKGFHLGLPTALWSPSPSADFHKTARRFVEHAAALADVTVDAGVYDKVRAFRAPNSRHPKTGLHKRRFTLDELTGLPLDRILGLSHAPAPFDLPEARGASEQAADDWQLASEVVAKESEAKAARRAATGGAPTLNRSTLTFIRQGADPGDRHRLLFSAAANLREFRCPPPLAFALLEESAPRLRVVAERCSPANRVRAFCPIFAGGGRFDGSTSYQLIGNCRRNPPLPLRFHGSRGSAHQRRPNPA